MRQMPINDKRLQHAVTMIITCQNCQTNYNIDANILGGGKAVLCQNCGNSWNQRPLPPPQRMAPPPPAPVYAEQVPFAPPPEPAPPPPQPAPELDADAVAAEAAERAAAAETFADDDAAAEGAAMEEAAEAEAGDEAGDEGAADALLTEQLDEMFGEDTGTDAFESPSALPAGGEDDGDDIDLDSIPDPEPIPQVFSPDDDEDLDDGLKKKGGMGKIIAIAAVAVVIALGAGAYFGKSFVIDLWPGAKDIYAMVNFGGEELGEGLDIRDVKSLREVESSVDILIVRGNVSNVSEQERMVPMIRVVLYDSNGEEVQSTLASPLKNRLPAGATTGFSAKISEPSALARRLEVTFTEAMKKGG